MIVDGYGNQLTDESHWRAGDIAVIVNSAANSAIVVGILKICDDELVGCCVVRLLRTYGDGYVLTFNSEGESVIGMSILTMDPFAALTGELDPVIKARIARKRTHHPIWGHGDW